MTGPRSCVDLLLSKGWIRTLIHISLTSVFHGPGSWDQALVAESAMTPAVACSCEDHIRLNSEQLISNQEELPSEASPEFS